MGYSIKAGAHETQLLVYDFDGDGKAEMILRTADGTTSGTVKDGVYRPVDFVGLREAARAGQDLRQNRPDELRAHTPKLLNAYSIVWEDPFYTNHAGEAGQDGYITSGSYTGDPAGQTWVKLFCFGPCVGSGDEYITAFDGETGHILDSAPYRFAIREPMWGINATCRRGASVGEQIAAAAQGYFHEGDQTHFNDRGGYEMAGLVIRCIRETEAAGLTWFLKDMPEGNPFPASDAAVARTDIRAGAEADPSTLA